MEVLGRGSAEAGCLFLFLDFGFINGCSLLHEEDGDIFLFTFLFIYNIFFDANSFRERESERERESMLFKSYTKKHEEKAENLSGS